MTRNTWCRKLNPRLFNAICEEYARLRGAKLNTGQVVIRSNVELLIRCGAVQQVLKEMLA